MKQKEINDLFFKIVKEKKPVKRTVMHNIVLFWVTIECWVQEWLLDWEGGPPYLYWWIRDKLGIDR